MRYSRQTVLPEIGLAGQASLGRARVLVVGAGGLGCPALLYLVAAGVGLSSQGGYIGIIDDDQVALSNLQRQVLFTEGDIGRTKVDAAVSHLRALNSDTNLRPIAQRLDAGNVLDILSPYEIIVDGSDNFATKYLINDAAARLGLPVVYGSILGLEGQASVFNAGKTGCYRCLYPEPPAKHIPNCAEAGTLGALAGMIGTIQAIEVCKLALGDDQCLQHGLESLAGRLLLADARTWDTRTLKMAPRPDCPICTTPPAQIELPEPCQAHCMSQSADSISLNDLNGLIESGIPFMLIDVRGHDEWAAGHLQGAHHLPLETLLANDDLESQLDPGMPLVVYCKHGVRSMAAVLHLQAQGFNALNLRIDGTIF